ncbi:MAG: hypothetical protein JSV89_08980 [Spirochaetaceae bacterium]|nr:MAG: hypothetical protein JSV89_08980 [Spirochaetaceae bacterium]
MKRSVILTLALIVAVCSTLSADIPLSERARIDLVVFTWIKALKAEGNDLYGESYWPDVIHTSYDAGGTVNKVYRGR